MALAVTAIFLRMNGIRLPASALEGEDFLVGRVIEAKADLGEITAWIEKHMRKAGK